MELEWKAVNRGVKTKDLLGYLKKFQPDSDVAFIVLDPVKRVYYPIREHNTIVDMGGPVFCLETGNPRKLKAGGNEEQIAGQMDIFDYF